MQYHEYISAYNARREREQQLANQYNQKPESQRVKNLWMVSVEKHDTGFVKLIEVVSILLGMIIVAAIIILSITVKP